MLVTKNKKECLRCRRHYELKDFKSLETGQEISLCTKCQVKQKIRHKHKKDLTPLYDVFVNLAPSYLKDEPYCMNCGKPFNRTLYELEEGSDNYVTRKRKMPVHWNIWFDNNNRKFIFCWECLQDRLNDKKFNLYKYKDQYDVLGTLVKKGVSIEDLNKYEYKLLFDDIFYPFNNLNKKFNEKYNY